MNITDSDIKLIESKGLTVEKVLSQIEIFKNEIPFVALRSAATLDNGITKFSEKYQKELINRYESSIQNLDTIKFVPASGAASRMFKELFRFLDYYNADKESLNSYTNHEKADAIRLFLIGLEKFPFYETVMKEVRRLSPKFDLLSEGEQLYLFVEVMLRKKGLNYGWYPKGLLPFHKYTESVATAFEEHLYEAAGYNVNGNKASKIHFTISKEHLDAFNSEFDRIRRDVETKTATKFEISYSFQKPETDTIAVTLDNKPFRLEDGKLFFRPGGHGALIENLNDLDADIIYIKNIDNVVVRKYQSELSGFKKVLAGKLLEIQKEVFRILESIDKEVLTDTKLTQIKQFLVEELNVRLPLDFDKFADHFKISFLKESLDRPIRVCGMVINEGEPGGGPFWIKQENGRVVLQIIEAPQINKNDRRQKDILASATHFNPVDLVCGVRNYKGEKFNLLEFVDPDSGFITTKTMNGHKLKALELPGLWNGAMSNWISVFVEVPLTTFNPVKSVNDLLKSAHQVKLFL
ncbi:DUF4301 family protein [Aquimarina sp. W85]|uniref:DUF4301 family protein n=1 Tax=Aquimarina rhodophyticola TaxID=3342246 RepID=UPI00366D3F6F